jgi:hypothetical protein
MELMLNPKQPDHLTFLHSRPARPRVWSSCSSFVVAAAEVAIAILIPLLLRAAHPRCECKLCESERLGLDAPSAHHRPAAALGFLVNGLIGPRNGSASCQSLLAADRALR